MFYDVDTEIPFLGLVIITWKRQTFKAASTHNFEAIPFGIVKPFHTPARQDPERKLILVDQENFRYYLCDYGEDASADSVMTPKTGYFFRTFFHFFEKMSSLQDLRIKGSSKFERNVETARISSTGKPVLPSFSILMAKIFHFDLKQQSKYESLTIVIRIPRIMFIQVKYLSELNLVFSSSTTIAKLLLGSLSLKAFSYSSSSSCSSEASSDA